MSEKITKISDSNFDSLVIIPKKPAVVCFLANWSGPSRIVRPTLEAAAEKHSAKVNFYESDVDENPTIQMTYGVRSVPTILFFAGGQLVDRYVGAVSRDKLEEKLQKISAPGEASKTWSRSRKNSPRASALEISGERFIMKRIITREILIEIETIRVTKKRSVRKNKAQTPKPEAVDDDSFTGKIAGLTHRFDKFRKEEI